MISHYKVLNKQGQDGIGVVYRPRYQAEAAVGTSIVFSSASLIYELSARGGTV